MTAPIPLTPDAPDERVERVERAVAYAQENASDLTDEGVGALARGLHDGWSAALDAAGVPALAEPGGQVGEGHDHQPGCGCQTVPRYAMLDVWMALGSGPAEFDAWYDRTGYADAWARICAEVRRRPAPVVPDSAGLHAIVGVGHSTAHGVYVTYACTGDDTGYGNGTPIPAATYVSEHLAVVRPTVTGAEPRPWEHPGHNPVQHRDRKPPWCRECGWTSPIPAVPAVQIRPAPSTTEGN